MAGVEWFGLVAGAVATLATAGLAMGLRMRRRLRGHKGSGRGAMLILINGGVAGLFLGIGGGLWTFVQWRDDAAAAARTERRLARLRSADAGERELACEQAGKYGWLSARDRLIELLQDPDGSVRIEAARALGRLGPPVAPQATRPLAMMLLTDQLAQARIADGALERLGAAAVPYLQADLAQGRTDLRIAAAAGLAATRQPGAQPLDDALCSPSAETRRAAVTGVGWHPVLGSGWWRICASLMGDDDITVRWTATWAFRRNRGKQLTDEDRARMDPVVGATVLEWLPQAAGPDRWRSAAARELAAYAGERYWLVRKPVEKALEDPAQARALLPALRHLGRVDEIAVPKLLLALWRPELRDLAIAELQRIQHPDVGKRLRSIAGSTRAPRPVREACERALAGLKE